ncbi:restriction endonuclease subunit S [Achromobacter xylosoxidans]|uniref:restriction endonuclease subunit S n=1 Tax=Alcaligenes xylosoxydans xylosoxydans TaxID=85698 RepID=UPI0009F1F491|nr:restriction endonuclease subunit S [Achromobacter xylosoxidans]
MSNEKEGMLMQPEKKEDFVPKLRFPEFLGAGSWGAGELRTVATFVNEKIPVNQVALKNYISTENILPDYGGITQASKLPNVSSVTRFKPTDTLVSNIRPYLKKIWYSNKEGGVSNDVIVIRAKQGYLAEYLSHLLKNDSFIDYVMIGAKGVKMPRGDVDSIRKYPTPIPSRKEQKKIADCLSSIDELITLEAQKINALKANKNGLMQKLFPAEGENLPKLRFSEFKEDVAWTETTIGKIGSFYYGKSAPKWSLADDAPTRCVRYGELYTKFDAVITETYSRTNVNPSNLRFSKGGEILVPRVGEKPEDFGRCCCYLPLKDIAIGEMISVFETKQNSLFYTYYFKSLYKQFAKVVEGQNVKNLYYAELEPLSICQPSLPEQKKIADLLASLDAVISAQSQKVDALKIHKKALMQRLFPKVVGAHA